MSMVGFYMYIKRIGKMTERQEESLLRLEEVINTVNSYRNMPLLIYHINLLNQEICKAHKHAKFLLSLTMLNFWDFNCGYYTSRKRSYGGL